MEFKFDDSLPKEEYIVSWVEKALVNGVKEKEHPFHIFVLGNVNSENDPDMRKVVLRDVDFESRELTFFTDYRSPKIKCLMEKPHVALLFYDPVNMIQLRVRAVVNINYKNVKAHSYWQKEKDMHKCFYLREFYYSSNFPVLKNDAEVPYGEDELESGYENFCAVNCFFHEIDFLTVHTEHHLRIQYNWLKKTRNHKWISPL